MKKCLTAALFATALLANPYESKQDEINAVTAIGQKASATLLKTLGGNLQKHLKAGGPMEAFEFCSTNAYALTQDVDKSLGKDVSIKRISLKYRNPANKPLDDEEPILRALHLMNQNGVVPPAEIIQNEGNGVYKYYKPLLINKEACLLCHGDMTKNKVLTAAIKAIYPSDRATGYKMNDLRGAIVVEVHQ
jgi:hypothetical protein